MRLVDPCLGVIPQLIFFSFRRIFGAMHALEHRHACNIVAVAVTTAPLRIL